MNIVNSNLRINMTGTERQPQAAAARYRAALEMAAYADAHGFASVNVEEHHCAENGWLPSPLTMAAAIAARTQHCRIGVMALLVTLYDPVRLAEDIAVIDLLSEGALSTHHRQTFQYCSWTRGQSRPGMNSASFFSVKPGNMAAGLNRDYSGPWK
jgi:hypothetical protein